MCVGRMLPPTFIHQLVQIDRTLIWAHLWQLPQNQRGFSGPQMLTFIGLRVSKVLSIGSKESWMRLLNWTKGYIVPIDHLFLKCDLFSWEILCSLSWVVLTVYLCSILEYHWDAQLSHECLWGRGCSVSAHHHASSSEPCQEWCWHCLWN